MVEEEVVEVVVHGIGILQVMEGLVEMVVHMAEMAVMEHILIIILMPIRLMQ